MPMGLHGIPRLFPRQSTGNRGHSTGFHGHSMGFHGMLRQVAEHRGCPSLSMAISTGRSTAISRAYHGIPRQAAVQRKEPRQCRRHGGGHRICRGSYRGTSVGCHGWYDGGCHGQNRGTCHGHNRGTRRGSAMYNGKPWPLPWKPADFHGSPWKDPRKTTEVPPSLPRTSTK